MRWITAGRLKAFKLPGRGNNRVLQDDLVCFLQQQGIPVPFELEEATLGKCVLIANDKHLERHVKRILRDADYLVETTYSLIFAGFQIAQSKPALVVIDDNFGQSSVLTQLLEFVDKIKEQADYSPKVLVITNEMKKLANKTAASRLELLNRPIDLHLFASKVESREAQVA